MTWHTIGAEKGTILVTWADVIYFSIVTTNFSLYGEPEDFWPDVM